MTFLRFLPVLLSALLLAAHFSRADDHLMALACLLAPLLLLVRRRWMVRVIQILLLVGAVVWVLTAVRIAGERRLIGEPWERMAVILGAVAFFTAASALSFETKKLKAGYPKIRERESAPVWAFALTSGLLAVVQMKVESPMLMAERFVVGAGWMEILLLSLYAGFITDRMLDPIRSAVWRLRTWILFSVVFFVQLGLGLAGLDRFLMTGKLHLPIPAMILAGPIYRGGGVFMPILFVVTVLLVGSAWCSHLCYIGAWDAAASMRLKKPRSMPEWRQRVRIGLVILVLVTVAIFRIFGVPGIIATSTGLLFGILGVGVMVLFSRRLGVMAHCVTYCPVGIVANWLGRLSPFRIRIKKDCTQCRICSVFCRYDALSPEDIQRLRPGSSCTLCGDCVGSCKDGWIVYGFAGLRGEKARVLFLVLIVSLHAVFLGVARI